MSPGCTEIGDGVALKLTLVMVNGVRVAVAVGVRRVAIPVAFGSFCPPGASVALAVAVPCNSLVGAGFRKVFASPDVPGTGGVRVGVADESASTSAAGVRAGSRLGLSSASGVDVTVGLAPETGD